MSLVQQAIEVSAPLHTVYEQLAAFENYPRFMSGVQEVTPIGSDRTHWIMEVDGKRREFDAQIIERSMDERVSWSTMEGPLLAETLTLRPMGETKTQVVAQLEADIAFLMPSDRHGQASLTKRLKEDLTTFKGLVESGEDPFHAARREVTEETLISDLSFDWGGSISRPRRTAGTRSRAITSARPPASKSPCPCARSSAGQSTTSVDGWITKRHWSSPRRAWSRC